MPRVLIALAGALAAASLIAAPLSPAKGSARSGCAVSGYGYAGVVSTEFALGVAARVSVGSAPAVRSGHVAAWVGVGDRKAWLQVGIATYPGVASRLYYEARVPGSPRRYVELGPVRKGERHALAVTSAGPGRWRAWVDGRPAGGETFLPGSEPGRRAVATAESWAPGGQPCNRFRYRFDSVTVAGADGSWRGLGLAQLLAAPGSRVMRGGSGFLAAGS